MLYKKKVKESVQGLCHEEFSIVMADTNDAECYSDSCFETNLAASTAHTNVIVIGFPYRNDKLRVTNLWQIKTEKTIDVSSKFKHAKFCLLAPV